MRELEFLPQWYPQTRRRRRLVILFGWMTVVMIGSLGLWTVLINRNVHVAEDALVSVDQKLDKSRSELVRMNLALDLQKQLAKQQQVLQKVGLHVESARLISALNQAMSNSMAILQLEYSTVEQQREVQPVAASTNAKREMQMDRWMEVKLVCIAPSDVELADFYANLQSKPFFRSVRISYTRDRAEQGHLMRQFEVMFSMDLNDTTGI